MTFRVLSLDGGGVWSLIQVKALIALYGENTTGHRVLRDFDLVAANSGGSLVLGALAEDLSLKQVLALFQDEETRRNLFSPTSKITDTLLRRLTGLGAKYSAAHKLEAIGELLPNCGGKTLAEAGADIRGPSGDPIRMLIVAFDYDRRRATFFRSARTEGPNWGDGAAASITLAQAIHASTNAPFTYFDAPAEFPGRADRYWDGAMAGCNNPLLAALTEAATLDQNLSDVRVLSLGTGSVKLPLAGADKETSPLFLRRRHPGLANDLRLVATSILDDPPDAATFIAHALTGGGKGLEMPAVSRIVRMSPMIQPVRDAAGVWSPPGGVTLKQFEALTRIDMDALEQWQVEMISGYCDLWLAGKVPNQPIRANGDTLAAEVGYGDFPSAQNVWRGVLEAGMESGPGHAPIGGAPVRQIEEGLSVHAAGMAPNA
ncbi:patatin-like phospholipase family protein [Telmatospirillum siberiense]|uniref:Patatin n=1 Tax=Telmatospirillum siberiense TaxID=382514 RepID=A0A2N3PNJ8_9PROT|nr:patatin-like phospholipase family protein [Telmatospirillum siberiense]PKU21981.1 patatin [Telmatospirillum siberiense]